MLCGAGFCGIPHRQHQHSRPVPLCHWVLAHTLAALEPAAAVQPTISRERLC